VLLPQDPHLLLQVDLRLLDHLNRLVEVLLLLLVMPLVHLLVSLPAEASTLVPPHQMFLQPAKRQALVLLHLQVLLHPEVLLDHRVLRHLGALLHHLQLSHPMAQVHRLLEPHLRVPVNCHLQAHLDHLPKALALLQAVHLL
jgi:hypothetical protein